MLRSHCCTMCILSISSAFQSVFMPKSGVLKIKVEENLKRIII